MESFIVRSLFFSKNAAQMLKKDGWRSLQSGRQRLLSNLLERPIYREMRVLFERPM
jgi:hypothetical protein